MGGENNFTGQVNSLWLYQNDIGATIYRGIHERKVEVLDDVPSSRRAFHLSGKHPMPIP